jgi:hypothetical protein
MRPHITSTTTYLVQLLLRLRFTFRTSSKTQISPFEMSTFTRPKPLVRPLRVVQVVEPGMARSSVGRMVISGRMSDVCRELDRLAELEACT